tara:strand:- start:7961 stop:8365 length:405 start_codon:yes stop_codon:yes gene_type:complete
MNKNPIPTAPISPLMLPPATAVAVARPFIHYKYKVYKRCGWCCYNECFLLTKKQDNLWSLTLYDNGVYDIPVNKTNEDITMIMCSLGVKKNSIYKVVVYNRDTTLQVKYFISLTSIVDFITKNEIVIEGVAYSG